MKSFKNNGNKHHVLGTVNDGNKEIMTTKYYFRDGKNSKWCYGASPMQRFEALKVAGLIADIRY